MNDLTEIDARSCVWASSAAESAHFTASREPVEWLFSRHDGEADPRPAKAFEGVAQKGLELQAEAAEPPLNLAEPDMALSISMLELEEWKDHDHADH